MKKLIPLFLIILTGCNVERRQMDKLDAYAVKYPIEMSRLANELYPCFTGKAKSDTVIKTHTDTLIQDGITTTIRIKDTVYVTKTLPGRTITNTRTLSIHDTVTNDRAIGDLKNQFTNKSDSLMKVNVKLEDKQKALNTWRWLAIGLLVLIGSFLAIKVYLLINGGWIKKII